MKSTEVQDFKKMLTEDPDTNVVCIDVRTPAEFRSLHIEGTKNIPLDNLKGHVDELKDFKKVYVICGTGARGERACRLLGDLGVEAVTNVEGGIEACKGRGVDLKCGKVLITLMRQVQIAAGSMILLGAGLAYFLNPYFWLLPVFVGAGLLFAGLSGTCMLGRVLMKMPWNK